MCYFKKLVYLVKLNIFGGASKNPSLHPKNGWGHGIFKR
jgi:hypothetical protein